MSDARLRTRLLTMARDFYARPTASLTQDPGVFEPGQDQGGVPILGTHEQTTLHTLLQPHYQSTQARMRDERVVLAMFRIYGCGDVTVRVKAGAGPAAPFSVLLQ